MKLLTKRLKKESEKKQRKTKQGALRNTKRNRTTKNSVEEGLKIKRLKRLWKQMKETNHVLSRTEPPGRGPRGQGCDTDKWRFCKAGSFSYGDSPRTPPLRELHSTDETRVWRDPGGSWACLPPAYGYGKNHPATGGNTCHLPQEKNCEKKGAIWNVKRTTKIKKSWIEDGKRDWKWST